MGLPKAGGTPQLNPKQWYKNSRNEDSFLTERRRDCVGRMVATLVNRPKKNTTEPRIRTERRQCAQCGKGEAHAHCTICHDYFHDNPKLLPAGEEKLIAVPTGKRTRDDQPVYAPTIANTYFHIWHANGREEAWGGRATDLCRG